jgi:hypothetical protein
MHQKRQTLSEMHQKRQTLSEMHNMLQQLQKLKHLLQEQQTLSDVYNTLQKLQEPDAGCDTQRELKLKLKQTHDTLQELQTRAHETLQAQRELCGKCDMLRAQQELVCDMLQEQQKLGEGYDLLQGLLNETQLFIQSSPDQIYRSNFETVQRWLKSLEPLKERLEQMLGAGQSKLQAIESEQLHASDSEQPGQSPYERLMKNKLQQRADIIVRMNKLTNRLLTSVCEVMFRLNPVQERRLRGMEQKDKIQKKQQRLLAVTIAGERAVRKAVETVESQMEYPVNMDFGDVSQLLVRSISGSLTLLQIDKAGHVYF